jgi:hypothetical protein
VRDFKNIDRLFQENLKDYEVFPPHKSWSTIDKRLNSTTKSRRLPFWLKISSIAALLMLFFSVGTIYFIPQNNFTKNFLPKKNNNNLNSSTNNDTLKSISTTSEIKNDSENVSKGKLIQLNSNQEISEQNIANNENVVVDNSTVEKKTSKTFNLSESKNLTYRSLNEQETISPKASESKFTVATIFAPIYFNSFGDGSGADSQFNNNQTSGSSSYSYGVKFAYQLNNKFSVQSGINMINLGHTTNNVYLTPGTAIVDFSNISSNPILAKDNPNLSKQSIDLANENTANLNQVFGYIEIPVELKYNVTDGKLGVNLVGGFSTLVLNKDEVFVETNTFSQSLGNSNNLRPLNFSGNFGVDIDYSLYKNIYINVSPMFKVQTNTFSKNSGSIQSYYLGVYTGLNYKF